MAPIRRYLRITKRSVLEVRIYLEKPSDSPWLLSSRDPILPRVMSEIRPKVLPKLREENENARKKGGKKKKGIKDVVSTEDFEVVIFLKELSTRHTLLTKQKHFDSKKAKAKRTGNKLTGWLNTSENPIDLEEDERVPTILREEAGEDPVDLSDIPEVNSGSKRKTNADEDDALFVSSDEDEQGGESLRARKRSRTARSTEDADAADGEGGDDKKKRALNTSYDGFSIYGRTLCLVVRRKGSAALRDHASTSLGGSQMMEQWISTQAAQEANVDENDDG